MVKHQDRVDPDDRLYRLLGERVQRARREAGLSQQDVATSVGVVRPSISMIEAGRQRPPLAQLVRIAEAVGLEDYRALLPDPAELLEDTQASNAAGLPATESAAAVRYMLEAAVAPFGDVTTVEERGDAGFDLLIRDANPVSGGTTLVELKNSSALVGPGTVGRLLSKAQRYGADRAALIASAPFAPAAVEFAEGKPVKLIDLGEFLCVVLHSSAPSAGTEARVADPTPPTRRPYPAHPVAQPPKTQRTKH